MTFLRLIATLVVSSTCSCAQAQPAQEQPQPAHRPDPIAELYFRVQERIGGAPRECGRYDVQRYTDPVLDPRFQTLLEESLACGRKAAAEGQSYWMYVQTFGIDSTVASGLMAAANGDLERFHYDSAPCGGPGCGPSLVVLPCKAPHIGLDASFGLPEFACER